MKPTIPQGTRDFNAETLRKRNYIFQIIRTVFELYGFQPLETPTMENLETLTGKYGEEGDQLLFKILNNGLNRPDKHEQAKINFEKILEGKNNAGITERALRYDLTIPFARYVAMNFGQLTMPFKRYQIQPVWRADRPQKGRYREFYQCDADIVGSNSLINEVEFVHIYAEVFKRLSIDVDIKINNRKILAALSEVCGEASKLTDITIAIDKLDKIGLEKVKEELLSKNLSAQQIAIIEKYLLIDGDNQTKLIAIKNLLGENETGRKGIEELEYILSFQNENKCAIENPQSETRNQKSEIKIDFTLARGLNYYTGTILEIKANNVQMGSIGGGGRYDDLTGLFGVPNLSGVGISFGVDRIYDVMEELKLFPETLQSSTKILLFNLGEEEIKTAYNIMQQLRSQNTSCEIYPDKIKLDKQFKYAEKKNIPYVVIIGSKEVENKTCVIKNIQTGVQQEMLQSEIFSFQFK